MSELLVDPSTGQYLSQRQIDQNSRLALDWQIGEVHFEFNLDGVLELFKSLLAFLGSESEFHLPTHEKNRIATTKAFIIKLIGSDKIGPSYLNEGIYAKAAGFEK